MINIIFICGASFAADRYVSPPGGYGTNDTTGGYTNWAGAATNIQWAVDKSSSPETVWVTNGTYYLTNRISITKGITLRSVNGREATTINGSYPAYTNRCFEIASASAVVTGFTIMNAYNTNTVWDTWGGGVKISAGTMRNCNITTNTAIIGGGLQVGTGVKIYDCIISSNSSIAGGAGMYIIGTDSIISNCVFRGNFIPGNGGGGGIYILSSGNIVINCTFISNSAHMGGGLLNGSGSTIIRNCIFYGNSCRWIGAGMVDYDNSVNTKIQNCTFARNIDGAGLYRNGAYDALVENCIIVSNSYAPNALTTNRNNRTDATITVGTSSGNITNNPLFANYSADNYRLANNSPCINTGTNQEWMTNALAVDLDGRMRIRYGTVDMGAYEYINKGSIFTGR